MLVLKRKKGERIKLLVPGRLQPITITILKCSAGCAIVGIDAERDISVARDPTTKGENQKPRKAKRWQA